MGVTTDRDVHVLTVIGYLRVSTIGQVVDGHGLDVQRAAIEAWCKKDLAGRQYELAFVEDPGISGAFGWEPTEESGGKYRKGLALVVRRIEEQGVDIVVVDALDRFGRDGPDWGLFAKRYVATGRVRFVSLGDGLDLSEDSDLLHSEILAVVSGWVRRNIARKVKAAQRKRKEEGLPNGTHYAWRSVPPLAEGARPTIEPDPEQAPWVPRIFEWCQRGWGARRIAEELERQGAPLPAGAQRWSRGPVTTILSDPLGAGYLEVDGELVRAHNYEDRLIERETFDAVRRELAQRRHEGKHPEKQPVQALYKTARCGLCDQPVQMTRQKRSKSQYAYRCRGSEWDFKETCRGWGKDCRLVDRVVLRQLSAFMDRPEFKKLVSEEARNEVMSEQVAKLTAERQHLEGALADKRRKRTRLLRTHLAGTVDEQDYDEEYRRIEVDETALRLELERIELQLSDGSQRQKLLAEVERAVTQLPALWEQLNIEERRKLLQEVIEHCYIDPLGDKRHRVRVKFHFLPEVVEQLPFAKSRITGLLDDVAHVSRRELAYLTLRSDGQTDKQIREHWEVTVQAVHYLKGSVLRRLGVEGIDEAIRLSQARIDRERDTLPLGPTGWHTGRRKAEGRGLRPRVEEALVRHVRGQTIEESAQSMSITPKSVKLLLWYARTALGCKTLEEAAEKYLEQKGGKLPEYD